MYHIQMYSALYEIVIHDLDMSGNYKGPDESFVSMGLGWPTSLKNTHEILSIWTCEDTQERCNTERANFHEMIPMVFAIPSCTLTTRRGCHCHPI